MRYTQLKSALSSIVHNAGYRALTDDKKQIEAQIDGFPIAWLKPPELLEKTGRGSGHLKYRIELALIEENSLQPTELVNSKLAKMESDMLEILTELSLTEGVVEITQICIKPHTSPLTNHKDISQICTAEITWYY